MQIACDLSPVRVVVNLTAVTSQIAHTCKSHKRNGEFQHHVPHSRVESFRRLNRREEGTPSPHDIQDKQASWVCKGF